MLLNFLGDDISQEEVWRKLHVYKKHSGLYGTYLSDVGSLALSRGHQATIIHNDWHWWDKQTMAAAGKGRSPTVKALRILKQKKKEWGDEKQIDKEIRFAKKGGAYQIQLPKLSAVDTYLQQNLPVILAVRSEELYHDPEETYTHFILVVGKKDNTYLIRDPYLAIEKIEGDELTYAWARQGGWMLVVHPKAQEKPQLPLFAS